MSGYLPDKQPGSILPRVVLVTTNPSKLLEQDYPNMVIEKEMDRPTQIFFNEQLDKLHDEPPSEDVVYGFVPEYCDFLTESAVSMVVNKLYGHSMIGTVYTDVMVREDNLAIRHYLPAFHPNMLEGDLIINGPIFIRSQELLKHPSLRFNKQLKLLYMHLFLHQAMRKIFSVHIAEALYIIKVPPNINMSFELKTVKQCLTNQ